MEGDVEPVSVQLVFRTTERERERDRSRGKSNEQTNSRRRGYRSTICEKGRLIEEDETNTYNILLLA